MALTESRIDELRRQFPALSRVAKGPRANGRQAVFFDGPAGTQVPQSVVDAVSSYLVNCNANGHGVFDSSLESDAELESAHQAAADLLGAEDRDCIAFGPNMTTQTLALARALGRTWQAGDEILLSGLEHDANYSPWVQAARDAGANVRVIDINTADCTLDMQDFQSKLNSNTKLVAVGCASNAAGTINPVQEICAAAASVGALSFLDAVHFAPHALIDVEEFGCDFLACSAYKFFGPHIGILWGRRELLENIQPYKLRPSPDDLPGRWMTGTQNHECIMGTRAAIDYLASLATEGEGRRERLMSAYTSIRQYEQQLCNQLLDGLATLLDFKVWGITEPAQRNSRFATVSLTHSKVKSRDLAQHCADAGIFAWHGNYYALPLTERIGVEPDGMLRIGLVHYNTADEVQYLLDTLADL